VHRAHNNSGIFYPVILRDGVAVGNWNPFGKGFSPTPFNEDDSLEGASEKWDRYQQFLKK
ncbi:MAG: winged helix DNA-binding domain-containing protein, partial [Bacteroidales bacterium]|nr:winged helix DNA-binding domain-containing protein [Bacteroidales bacterium]